MNATAPLLVSGLGALAPDYSGILCDVWGVLHNGVTAFPDAHGALQRFREEAGGAVILITNAPRPAAPIHDQLAGFGVTRAAYDDVVTSGDVTRHLLIENLDRKVVHMGPERDMPLYEGLDIALTGDDAAELISCTGLIDDERETPDDYRDRLTRLAARGLPMICANPDIVVERGERLIWCAGALARLYEDLGGTVTILGKPHKPIYSAALARLQDIQGAAFDRNRVLAIGDGLPTDIRGAVSQDLDVLFITAGIHAADFGPSEAPDEALIRRRLAEEGLSARAAVPRLRW
ncbi:TIGR01459 family HAD-type hydrolase [Polymorphum gilvum]|uniref:HAD-superfamily subfamily IIA hydrolase, TIGR01459 n=1 Tax=Polymorphum gilvum (strain LMG 25793 / CGMCC 1.9160 / SL003B-26A1) TaxID=991905 RepID=F2J024_POLGS|nr:TIGR01459 family HAD-type hydrolase [Polymorphum gilvum]ADZ71858.1 HAD-superfamily subfamily IIA hydrolase, TIGR01459 [Polymorphum gilvum SL003B-26A1]